MGRQRAEQRPLTIGVSTVEPGERATVDLPVASLYTRGELTMPVRVIRGRKPGPTLFVSAAVHGDEINGVEVVRRLLRHGALKRLRGTLLAVPVVNVFGFIGHSRFLPDGRDLNRSFPGSGRGSLAARLADRFMREVVANSTHGIDLHSASSHRSNLPHVRACLDVGDTEDLARAFGAPVVLGSPVRDGSLRGAVSSRGIPLLVYEGGEALRFDEMAIRAGTRGVISVMETLGMLPTHRVRRGIVPVIARSSRWVRAPDSGILRASAGLGDSVSEGQRLGVIGDPLGDHEVPVRATADGIVVGRTQLPLVNEGDGLFHIACVGDPRSATEALEAIEAFQEQYAGDVDDDEVDPEAGENE